MHGEEIAQEQRQVLHKLLVPRIALGIGRLEIHRQRDDGGNGREDLGEHLDKLLVVVAHLARARRLQAANLGQALQGNVAELGNFEEACAEGVNKRGLEDVAEGDPVAETQQGFEGGLDKASLGGRVENLRAELEDLRELGAHGGLEVAGLCGRHLLGGVVEDLLGEETQDDHVVLADRQAGAARGDDFVDERGPVVRPLLLQDRDEDEVELVQQGLVFTQGLLRVGALDDKLHNKVADTLALVPREDLPSRHDDMVKHLQGEELGLRVGGLGEDLVDDEPSIGVLLELVQGALGLFLL